MRLKISAAGDQSGDHDPRRKVRLKYTLASFHLFLFPHNHRTLLHTPLFHSFPEIRSFEREHRRKKSVREERTPSAVSSKLLGSLCEGHGTCWGSLDRVATDIISSGGLWGRQPEPHQGVFVQPPRGVVVVVFAVVVVARCRGSTVASLSKPPLHVQGIRDQDVYVHHGESDSLSFFSRIAILPSFSLALSRSSTPTYLSHLCLVSTRTFIVYLAPRVLLSLCPYLHPRSAPARSVCFSFAVLLASLRFSVKHAQHQHDCTFFLPRPWPPPLARIPYPLRIQQLYPPWTLLCTRVASRQAWSDVREKGLSPLPLSTHRPITMLFFFSYFRFELVSLPRKILSHMLHFTTSSALQRML